jgi:hypothetical protein
MASIKNFNLVGVGSQVQFGKGGPQITQNGGVFGFYDPTNTTLVPVQVATPTAASHAVTKSYVDTQVGNISTAHIRDNSTSPKAQVATDEVSGDVTIDVSTGTAGARIATFSGSAASNSSLNIDNATAGQININAYSSTATDVSVFINPQGNGRVYIGNNLSDSALQADDGQSLTLAGGDSTTANGGNLYLRGGNTTHSGSTNGNVILEDSTGATSLTIAGVTGSNSSLTASNGIAQATISVATSVTNADLVLAPAGTGAVNVSNAAIHNVANPTNAQDAATKNYVDTQITANKSGSMQCLVATTTTTTTNLGSPITGRIRYVTVEILTPYTAGATITLGTSTNATQISDASQQDETTAGLYSFQVDVDYTTATQIVATVNGSPATGQARVMIDYIQNG